MPTGERQRNQCIGRFAWRLREILPELRRGEDEAIIQAWYAKARPVIRTQEFGATLADFRVAWRRYKPPPPGTKPQRALAIAASDPAVYHPDPECNRIARLMRAMASLSTEPDGRFPLSCHQMEAMLGIPYSTANRKAGQLAHEGLVELVERGQAGPGSGKAHCWRWIGGA